MVKKRIFPSFHLIVLFLLASNLMMAGCEPDQLSVPTLTPTPTLANIPSSTSSFTPTSVPTVSWQIGFGTLVPLSQPVNETNVNQIRLIASIPENPERIYRISSDHKLLFIADTHGIDVFNLDTQTLVRHLPFGLTLNTSPHEIDPSGINEGHFSISTRGDTIAIIDFEGVKVISLEGGVLFSSALEIPFSPGLSPRAVTTRYSLALSPDGEYLAVSSSTDGVGVIQLSDGKTIDTPNLVGSNPRFSPNGEILVTMTNSQLVFWNTDDWTKIQDIYYRGHWPLFTFVSDSTILLHNWSNSLELWDINHRNRIRTIDLVDDRQKFIVLAQPLISSNGEFLAVLKRDIDIPCFELSPITVTVFNLNGEKLSEQTTPFESRNCQPYFLGLNYISSPILLRDNGEAITVLPPADADQWGTIVQEMEISSAQKILPQNVESYLRQDWDDFEYDFELSPDGRYVALSLQKGAGSAMVIYDASENQPLYWGSSSYTSGSFSPDSTIFAMNLSNSIKMINLSSNQNMQAVTVYEDQRLVPDAPMAISPDRTIMAAIIAKDAISETVGFITINDGTLIYQWPVGNDEINSIRFSEDGKYLIVSTYGGWVDILGVYP